MPSLDSLCLLTRYKAWADDLMLATLAAVPEQVLQAERKIVFGSILRTLNHLHLMDLVWKAHLEGTAHGFTTRNPRSSPSFSQIRASQGQVDAWYIDYADGLSGDRALQSVEFEFIGGGQGAMSRCEILLHVVNHSTYHRGHIAGMLHEAETSAPTTDLPVFLQANSWRQEPAWRTALSRWPAPAQALPLRSAGLLARRRPGQPGTRRGVRGTQSSRCPAAPAVTR